MQRLTCILTTILGLAATLLATQPLLQQAFSVNPVRGFDDAPAVIAALLSGECRGPIPIAVTAETRERWP